MTLPAHDLQKAVFAKLTANASLSAAVDSIYDEPQTGCAFPYVAIGDGTTASNNTKDADMFDVTVTLHVWSQAGGRMECKQIMGLVFDALQEVALILDSGELIEIFHEFSDDFRDPDGRTYHGVMRFRAMTQA